MKRLEEVIKPINYNEACGCSNLPCPKPGPESAVQEKISKAISESSDLISALECVGAMYGIPSTNIISDDTATGIRVQNDNIIAPPLPNPKNQTKPIIQAVGSVLDYISQRIDDKLNDYQMNNIKQGRIDDGIDVPRKPIELVDPSNGGIPSGKSGLSYFTDDDDITNGVNMNASSTEAPDDTNDLDENDVANQIQESAYHLNMISKLGNTTHLGYDLLHKHGFDFVKPIDSIITESAKEKENKSESKVHVEDIKYLKFDNKQILKAVELFNKLRDKQDNIKSGNIDLNKFINDPDYEKAIDCLNRQFDCRINLRFYEVSKQSPNCETFVGDELKKKMTISKSKGFQLGGLPIEIAVLNHYFEKSSPKDIELFGQSMVSTICHEIFHNIASVMRSENAKVGMSLKATLDIAASAKTAKDKRIIINNFIDTLEEGSGLKFNVLTKKKLVKELVALSSVANNEKAVKEIRNKSDNRKENADKYIDKLIKKYKKTIKTVAPSRISYMLPLFASATSIICGTLIPGLSFMSMPLIGIGLVVGIPALSVMTYNEGRLKLVRQYDEKQLYEEYYCDLFASMYQLPKVFFVGGSKKKYTTKEFDDKKLKELSDLEREFYRSITCSYPTDFERTHAGVRVAERLLKEKDLDPSTKKYCQWIVDNFSNVKKLDIDKIYNKTTFDPKEAEDLDKHLSDLINDNNIVLTESFMQWLTSDQMII